jgi:hypothetical protein
MRMRIGVYHEDGGGWSFHEEKDEGWYLPMKIKADS